MAKYQAGNLEIRSENGEWILIGNVTDIKPFAQNPCDYGDHDVVFISIDEKDHKKAILGCRKCYKRGELEICGLRKI